MTNKTVVTEYDDFLRLQRVLLDDESDKKFFGFVENAISHCSKFSKTFEELSRVQEELIQAKAENLNLQLKLKSARQLLDIEKQHRLSIEKEKSDLENQISMVKDMLNQGNIETKEKLQILSSTFSDLGCQGLEKNRINLDEVLSTSHLSTIIEDADTVESIINVSDMELTGGIELEMSNPRSGRSFQFSPPGTKSGQKRKSSSNKINTAKSMKASQDSDICTNLKRNSDHEVEIHSQAGFKLTAPPLSSENIANAENCAIHCINSVKTSQISLKPLTLTRTPVARYIKQENSPSLQNIHNNHRSSVRTHYFVSKTIYWADFCQPCGKRIKFGKPVLKCRDCRTTCHIECQDAVPLPCVPAVNTPGSKIDAGFIADFAPRSSPMVPAIIVHCTIEIEKRGLTEVGIYRVPGADREVKELRDRFLKGKGVPNLSNLDIYVICSAVKAFLMVLKEPIIPNKQWKDFVSATEKIEKQDAYNVLFQAISQMPRPNKDTLAWMISHLQRISESYHCKMPSSNLAKVFGPTLLGYSVPDPDPLDIVQETKLQQKVMEILLEIPSEYWKAFINIQDESFVNELASPGNNVSARNTRRRSILSRTPLSHI